MGIASASHLSKGDDLATASHAIELAFLFLGLFFIGPGKLSVDKH
jgi:putative oxidoreductase